MIRATLTDGRVARIEFYHTQYFNEFNEAGEEKRSLRFVEIPGTDNAWARGFTRCYLVVQSPTEDVILGDGTTWCSQHDQFNKETGRQIALWRAVTALSKADRGIVVAAYFNRKRGATKPTTTLTTTN